MEITHAHASTLANVMQKKKKSLRTHAAREKDTMHKNWKRWILQWEIKNRIAFPSAS